MSDPSLGLALRVIFKQPYTTGAQLKIDLTSLRLKEIYEKNKLKLMERYATETQQNTRAETFSSYFYGKQPLIPGCARENPYALDMGMKRAHSLWGMMGEVNKGV